MNIVYLDSFALNPGDLSWDGLTQLGAVTLYDSTESGDVVTRLEGAEVVVVNKVLLPREVLAQLSSLKLIAVTATGVNNVDVEAARELGISVCNVPAYSTMSVVQMIFAHIFQMTNDVSTHAAAVNSGEWQQSAQFCFWHSDQVEIAGKTMGIAGFGNIGQALARVALAFGMTVKVYNRSRRETELDIMYVTKEELMDSSDIIALACALTEDTYHFINKETLKLMKSSALLINTGRGPLVNEEDLRDALEEGRIAGAGIDVLSQEPPRDGSPLIGAKNCAVTPHIAWATKEARTRALAITVENIKHYIAQTPQNVVN